MVADAVAVEPLSTTKFPANREKNREFCKITASGAAKAVNNAVVTGLPVQISYLPEQGIVLAEHGILLRKQGILSTGIKGIAKEASVRPASFRLSFLDGGGALNS